ncbi:MAG: hypothetical protein ACYSQZ_07980 [Planctomycetota bacterium]
MMKTVILKFNPFSVGFDGRIYTPGDSSKKRLDRTLVNLTRDGKLEMVLYSMDSRRILLFEPVNPITQMGERTNDETLEY